MCYVSCILCHVPCAMFVFFIWQFCLDGAGFYVIIDDFSFNLVTTSDLCVAEQDLGECTFETAIGLGDSNARFWLEFLAYWCLFVAPVQGSIMDGNYSFKAIEHQHHQLSEKEIPWIALPTSIYFSVSVLRPPWVWDSQVDAPRGRSVSLNT